MTHMVLVFSMSKGGQGAAAANILLLKKSEESRKQETVIRDAIRVMLKNKQPNTRKGWCPRTGKGQRFMGKGAVNGSVSG